MQPCRRCCGSGKEPDLDDVARLREERIRLRVFLGDMARAVGCTSAHLSSVEHGRFPMLERLRMAYVAALEKARNHVL